MLGERPQSENVYLYNADTSEKLRAPFKIIDSFVMREKYHIPDPWELIHSSFSRDYFSPPGHGYSDVELKKILPIPERIMKEIGLGNKHSFMGLLPCLDRAWISIDNHLYLWNLLSGYALH